MVWECKESLDGALRCFPLERWAWSAEHAVGRWRADAAQAARYGVAEGTVSWGVWWRTRPYGAYRLHAPDGALRGYRLDVIDRVRIRPDAVRYRDLLLDAWIRPDGAVRFEDEDEVAAALAAQRLPPALARRIGRVRAVIAGRPERIIGRIDAAIARAIAAAERGRG